MRRKDEKKEDAILKAAIQAIAESGFHSAKVSRIAEIAGVATGTVYLYYPSKEILLHKIFEKLWSELTMKFEKTIADQSLTPIEKFEKMIDLFLEKLISDNSLAIVFANEHHLLLQTRTKDLLEHYNRFVDLGQIVLNQGIASGMVNPDINLNVIRYFILGGFRNLIRERAVNPDLLPWDVIRASTKSLLRHGMMVRN